MAQRVVDIELKPLLLVSLVPIRENLVETDVLFHKVVLLKEHGKLYYSH